MLRSGVVHGIPQGRVNVIPSGKAVGGGSSQVREAVLPSEKADNLYELVSERTAAGGSMILTSNRSPVDWYPLFPNPVVAESLLDRLINTSHQVFMNGPHTGPTNAPAPRTNRCGANPLPDNSWQHDLGPGQARSGPSPVEARAEMVQEFLVGAGSPVVAGPERPAVIRACAHADRGLDRLVPPAHLDTMQL